MKQNFAQNYSNSNKIGIEFDNKIKFENKFEM